MSEAGQNAHVVSLRNQIDHKCYQETPKSAGCFGGMVMEYCIEKTEDAQNYSDNLGMLMRILDPSPQILFHTLHCFKRTGINTKPPKLQYRKRTRLRVLGCLFAANTRSAAQRQRIQTRMSILPFSFWMRVRVPHCTSMLHIPNPYSTHPRIFP